jgi:hypothetical protein
VHKGADLPGALERRWPGIDDGGLPDRKPAGGDLLQVVDLPIRRGFIVDAAKSARTVIEGDTTWLRQIWLKEWKAPAASAELSARR